MAGIEKPIMRYVILIIVFLIGTIVIIPIETVEAAEPDLVVQSIEYSPTTISEGSLLTFTITIKNQGAETATFLPQPWEPYLGLYVDGNYKGGFFNEYSSTVISPGSTKTVTYDSWNPTSGSHTIRAIADPDNVISESSESNNERTITLTVADAPKPDLIINDVSFSPINPSVGDLVTISAEVKNIGSVATTTSFFVYYYVDGVYKDYTGGISLSASATTTVRCTTKWTATSGTHSIKATADATSLISESNENNNEKSTSVSVGTQSTGSQPEPDLIVQSITYSPTSPDIGDTITFTVIIHNQGTAYAGSSTVKYYVDNGEIASDSVNSLSAGSTTTETFTWSLTSGTHTIKAVVDTGFSVSESNEYNNEKSITVSGTATSGETTDTSTDETNPDNTGYDESSNIIDKLLGTILYNNLCCMTYWLLFIIIAGGVYSDAKSRDMSGAWALAPFLLGIIGLIIYFVARKEKVTPKAPKNNVISNRTGLDNDSNKSNNQRSGRFCVSCGRSIPFDAKLCPYCGHDYRNKERLTPVRKSTQETRKIKQKSKPLPPPPPRTIVGQTKITGKCQRCGSRNLKIYPDGSGMCNACKKTFM